MANMKNNIPPEKLFLEDPKLSKQFNGFKLDEKGIPQFFPNNEPISSKTRKFCEKKWNKQKAIYEKNN